MVNLSKSLINYVLLISCFLLCIDKTCSQSLEEINYYKEKFPDAEYVILNNVLAYKIQLKNGKIEITSKNTNENLYLVESANKYSSDRIYSNSFNSIDNITAYSTSIEGKKRKKHKVKEFYKGDNVAQHFRDDGEYLKFTYPNLKEGSTSYLEYETTYSDPRLLKAIFFGETSPVIHAKLIVEVDDDVSINFHQFNTENLVSLSKETKRNNTIYTFESNNIDATSIEYQMPPFQTILPHIHLSIASVKSPTGNIVNILSNEQDLYNWYYNLTKDVNKDPASDELTEIVKNITSDSESDLDKVKQIYSWVQNNITYLDDEYGLGGFIPREANDICHQKYGDCKDNSSIMKKMLEVCGIDSYFTWIGTRDVPYKYTELPTPAIDNHMILTYIDGGKYYFLDATGRNQPIDLPTSFIQGKEALVGISKDSFQIVEIPVIEANTNIEKNINYLSLNNDVVIGKCKTSISGYKKLDVLYEIEKRSDKDKLDSYFSKILEKGNNKFSLIDSSITVLETQDSLQIYHEYKIPNYSIQFGDEIILNLNLEKVIEYYQIEEDRKHDIIQDYKTEYHFINKFTIPENYQLSYLPTNVDTSSKYLSGSISYKKDGNQIIYEHKVVVNFIKLPISEIKDYRNAWNTINKAYKENIILKEI